MVGGLEGVCAVVPRAIASTHASAALAGPAVASHLDVDLHIGQRRSARLKAQRRNQLCCCPWLCTLDHLVVIAEHMRAGKGGRW